jgi:hypothetical protein
MAKKSALIPALVAALVPKCPFCVAAYLSMIGVSAGAAGAIAPLLRVLFLVVATIAIGLALLPLGKLALRTRNYAPLLGVTTVASAALALCVAGAPLLIRILGLALLLVAWLWAERRLKDRDQPEDCCGFMDASILSSRTAAKRNSASSCR